MINSSRGLKRLIAAELFAAVFLVPGCGKPVRTTGPVDVTRELGARIQEEFAEYDPSEATIEKGGSSEILMIDSFVLTYPWELQFREAGLSNSQMLALMMLATDYDRKISSVPTEDRPNDVDPFEDLPEEPLDEKIGLETLDLNQEMDRILTQLKSEHEFTADQLKLVSEFLHELTNECEGRWLEELKGLPPLWDQKDQKSY